MNLRDLLVLYGLVGIACAVAVVRRAPTAGAATVASAFAAVVVWPLWAPFALAAPGPRVPGGGPQRGAVDRIERSLAEAVDAVAGTPMSDIFSTKISSRISAEVARVAARLDELSALVARAGFDPQASAQRVRDLETGGAHERAVVTARLQHESLTRLQQLRASDAQALEDLADLLDALRAQLLLARYSGSSADGASAIVGEVWARLEGLGAAFDVTAHERT